MDKKREAQLLLIHQMYKQHPLSDFGFTFWPLWSHRLDNTKTVSSENWIKFVTLPLVACTPIKVYPTKLLKNQNNLAANWWNMISFISIQTFLNSTFCLFYITVINIRKFYMCLYLFDMSTPINTCAMRMLKQSSSHVLSNVYKLHCL